MWRIAYQYTERALKQQKFSQIIRNNLEEKPLQQIMHQFQLFYNCITIFDYDYYNHCSHNLIQHQKKMSLQDIALVLKLGQEHNIKNHLLWKHFENQFHLRLDQTMGSLIRSESQIAEKSIEKTISMLNNSAQDHFQLLTEEFLLEQKNERKEEIKQEIQQLKQVPNVQQTLQNMEEFIQLLMWSGSKNMSLFTLILQSFLHPKYNLSSGQSIIKFASMLTYSCQIMMQEYKLNKNNYLGRSLKNVYNYQAAYFPELIKELNLHSKSLNNKQITTLIQILLTFPIKRRAHKKQISHILLEECLNRKLDEKIILRVGDLIGKDKKLKEEFLQKANIQAIIQNDNTQS